MQLDGHLVGGELLLEEEEESVDCWPMFDDFKFADRISVIADVESSLLDVWMMETPLLG